MRATKSLSGVAVVIPNLGLTRGLDPLGKLFGHIHVVLNLASAVVINVDDLKGGLQVVALKQVDVNSTLPHCNNLNRVVNRAVSRFGHDFNPLSWCLA